MADKKLKCPKIIFSLYNFPPVIAKQSESKPA